MQIKFALYFLVLVELLVNVQPYRSLAKDYEQFNLFLDKFGGERNFEKTEYYRKYRNFKKSLRHITKLNKLHNQQEQPVFGVTPFADLSPSRFNKMMLSKKINSLSEDSANSEKLEIDKTIPLKVDW